MKAVCHKLSELSPNRYHIFRHSDKLCRRPLTDCMLAVYAEMVPGIWYAIEHKTIGRRYAEDGVISSLFSRGYLWFACQITVDVSGKWSILTPEQRFLSVMMNDVGGLTEWQLFQRPA